MNWFRNLFQGKMTATRPIRKNVRLQVDRLEDRWAPAISITTASLPNWTLGLAYNQTVATSGGSGTEAFSVSTGTLPTGLSLNATSGAITGTPTAVVAADAFTIMVTDSAGDTPATHTYTVAINPAVAFTTTSPLPTGTVTVAYTETLAVTGGTGADTFAVTTGTLPAGLALNKTTDAITGTPTTAVVADPFTITATDSVGATGSQAFALTIFGITTTSLPNWTANYAFNQTVETSGATGTETFSVSTGTLPTGLSLNTSTGAITGVPTLTAALGGGAATAKSSTFTIKAADSAGDTPATESYTVTINPAVTLATTLPGWTVNEPGYNQTIGVTGGTGADTFAFTGGTLPTGLSLNTSSGAITGTPTIEAAYSFQITATDSVGATGSATYSVSIGAALAISTTTLPAGTTNVAYSQTIATTGGTGTPIFSYTGTLPPGVPLSTAGVLSGTPTTAGTYTFTITATDTGGAAVSHAYTVKISPGSALQPATLPNWTVNETGYSQTITVTSSTSGATYTFAVTTGALPPGLSLDTSTGAITGTPTKTGAYTFTITATSSTSTKTAQSYTVTISPAIVIKPAALATVFVNQHYSQTITASGGTGTITLTYTLSGTLPPGLTITLTPATTKAGPKLTIAGTPRNDDYAGITVTATDSAGTVTVMNFGLPTARRRGAD